MRGQTSWLVRLGTDERLIKGTKQTTNEDRRIAETKALEEAIDRIGTLEKAIGQLVDEREGRKKREDLEEAAFLAQAGRSPAIDKTIYQSLGFVPIATPVQNGEIIEVFLRRRMN